MNVKSAFLNNFIEKEVYFKQPPSFGDQTLPDHVFKLKKALYGPKQASHAWYDRLSVFLLQTDFMRNKVDS